MQNTKSIFYQQPTCQNSVEQSKQHDKSSTLPIQTFKSNKTSLPHRYVRFYLKSILRNQHFPSQLIQHILLFLYKSPYPFKNNEFCLSMGSIIFQPQHSCFINSYHTERSSQPIKPGCEFILGLNYPFTTTFKVQEVWEFNYIEEVTNILEKVKQFNRFIRKSTHEQKKFLIPKPYQSSQLQFCEQSQIQNSSTLMANFLSKFIRKNYIKIDFTHNLSKKKETYIIMENATVELPPTLNFKYCQSEGWSVESSDVIWQKKSSCSRAPTVIRRKFSNQFRLLDGDSEENITHISKLPQKLDYSYLQSNIL